MKIKFRAYIKPLKRYAKDYETILYHHQCNMEPTWTVNVSPEEVYGDEDLIIEQYTGLNDKNGKEMCVGDIVNLEFYKKPHGKKKRWTKPCPHKDINIVGFEDGYFKFYTEVNEHGSCSELSFSDYGEWSTKDFDYKYVAKIIGNVHKDRKLLEENKESED